MKRSNRKGFTTVELVIVIAVIAILAAVLIPTFVSLIKKAEESAYLQEKTNQMILDMQEEVLNKDYMTWEEFETELNNLLDEKLAGVNTGLTEDQVREIINAALSKLNTSSNGLTKAQVEKIIKNALKDIDTGMSKEELEQLIKDLLENQQQPTEPEVPTEPSADEFASLADAIASGASNIKLTANQTITSPITLDRDVTIDLADHVISYNGDWQGLFIVNNGAKVVLKNGIIDAICADDADNWVEGKVISVENATLTIDNLKIYARGAEDGTDLSGIQLGANANVIMNGHDSLIQMPGASSVTENGNVTITYGGQYAAIRLYGEDNSSFTMNDGLLNVVGTGCKYAIQDLGGGSNNTITLNGGTINVENQGDDDTDDTAAFELRGSVASIVANGVEIIVKGTDNGEHTFLNSRYTSFKGTIEYKGTTKVTVTNCAAIEQASSTGKFGGTFLVNEGTYSANFATWTADGYSYTAG